MPDILIDSFVFLPFQIFLIATAIIFFIWRNYIRVRHFFINKKNGGPGMKAWVTRSDESVSSLKFYFGALFSFYVGLNVVVEADIAKNYKVIWSLVDLACAYYLTLVNMISRDYLLRFKDYLKNIERS